MHSAADNVVLDEAQDHYEVLRTFHRSSSANVNRQRQRQPRIMHGAGLGGQDRLSLTVDSLHSRWGMLMGFGLAQEKEEEKTSEAEPLAETVVDFCRNGFPASGQCSWADWK